MNKDNMKSTITVNSEKSFRVFIVLAVLTLIIIIAMKQPSKKIITELTDNINEAKINSSEFLKQDSELYSVQGYKDIDIMKKYVTPELFIRNYTNNSNFAGLPDTIENHKFIVDEVVGESVSKGYIVIIYGWEYFGDTQYPYTAIIKLNKERIITDFAKIQHN